MQVYRSLADYPAPPPDAPPAVVTIGTFDGVHLGHRAILQRLLDDAAAVHGQATVITFHPHPRQVLRPDDTSLRLLHTLDEKLEALAAAGIHQTLVLPFTRELASTPSETFIHEVLHRTLRAHTIVIGYDHRFGAGRGGGIDELREAGTQLGFAVEEISAQQIDEANVSSTKIRQALQAGQVDVAQRLLGYAYHLRGTVVAGQALGRTIGYPTANLHIPDAAKLVPGIGIYAVQVQLTDGSRWPGMMSIGTNPTVTADTSIKLEVNLIGFQGDLYGQTLRVDFLARLRDEARYPDLASLTAQLARDQDAALAAYAANHPAAGN